MPIPRTSPSHPRKRPRQGRSINTVDAILEAAARLLERDGFAGFNTNVIAALAGVSTGSLYQYYPDKEAILRALVVTSVQARAALAVGAIREHAGPGALAAALEAALAHAQERPVLTRQLAFAEPLVLVAEHDQEIAEELLASLQDAIQSDHEVSPGMATELASDVLGICKGMLLSAVARDAVSDPGLARKIILATDAYLNAVAAR